MTEPTHPDDRRTFYVASPEFGGTPAGPYTRKGAEGCRTRYQRRYPTWTFEVVELTR